MKNRLIDVGLHISMRCYRYLLMLYPPQFHGDKKIQMQLDHQDAYYDAWHQNGFYGVLCLWTQVFIDIVPDVVREYLHLKKEGNMREFWAGIAVLTSAVVMLVTGVIGIALWLDTIVNLYNPIEQSILFVVFFNVPIFISGMLCRGFWGKVAEAIN